MAVSDVSALLAGPPSDDGEAGGRDPIFTYCDDASGERTELTGPQLAGWAARTAHLLRDGCELAPGSKIAVLLPPHWLTAGVLLGAWWAGAAMSFRLASTSGLPAREPGGDGPLDAVFAWRSRVDDWLEDIPDAPHKFALGPTPERAVPSTRLTGYRDYLAEVADYPDDFTATTAIRPTDQGSADGTSLREWGSIAQAIAADHDLQAGDKVLVVAETAEHPLYWLLAPLSVGASIVLCANLDPEQLAERAATEHATRTW